MAMCAQPNDHAQLISEILVSLAIPIDIQNFYDTQRLPGYKNYSEHEANRLRITQVLEACTCNPDAKTALKEYERNWNVWLSTPAFKDVTDETLRLQDVPRVESPIPAPRPPPELSTSQEILATSAWNPTFKDVEGRPTLRWRKHVPTKLCRKIENTFWTALSHALWGNDQLWAVLKATTCAWFNEVMACPTHPRHPIYKALDNYATSRSRAATQSAQQNSSPSSLPSKISSLESQLSPSASPAAISPEVWQIIADAHHVELLVISAWPASDGKLPLIPRGDANTRQVFLLREQDGEYVSVRPEVADIYNFRFDYHRPAARAAPPKTAKAQREATAAQLVSDQRRCPLLRMREEGDGVNASPLMVIDGDHGVTLETAGPLGHILSEAAWMQWTRVTAEQVDRYVNTTPLSWR